MSDYQDLLVKLKNGLNCCICHNNNYSTTNPPVNAKCGHLMCLNCFNDRFKSDEVSKLIFKHDEKQKCPICKQKVFRQGIRKKYPSKGSDENISLLNYIHFFDNVVSNHENKLLSQKKEKNENTIRMGILTTIKKNQKWTRKDLKKEMRSNGVVFDNTLFPKVLESLIFSGSLNLDDDDKIYKYIDNI